MDAQKIGAFIASVRKEKGLTQSNLAELLFVSDKTISKWERGAGFPDIKNLEPLAAALGVSLVELMQGEREKTNEISITKAGDLLNDALQLQSKENQTLKMLSYGITVIFAVISCFLLFLLLRDGSIVLYSIVSLLFGLAAWLIPVCMILQKKYRNIGLSILVSMALALASLVTQFFQTRSDVISGDWAAIEDTIFVLVMVVVFFSSVTILLNSILFLKSNRKRSS